MQPAMLEALLAVAIAEDEAGVDRLLGATVIRQERNPNFRAHRSYEDKAAPASLGEFRENRSMTISFAPLSTVRLPPQIPIPAAAERGCGSRSLHEIVLRASSPDDPLGLKFRLVDLLPACPPGELTPSSLEQARQSRARC